jgi:oligopeptide transport system ATP-binding protein
VTHLLEVRDLTTRFYTSEGVVHAVNGISYTLGQGEALGIVGESGCGKSVSVLSVLGLIPEPPGKITAGQVLYRGWWGFPGRLTGTAATRTSSPAGCASER